MDAIIVQLSFFRKRTASHRIKTVYHLRGIRESEPEICPHFISYKISFVLILVCNLDLRKGLINIDFLSICHMPMLTCNVLDIWLSQKMGLADLCQLNF